MDEAVCSFSSVPRLLRAFHREDAEVGDTWEYNDGQTLAIEEWDIVMQI